MGGKAVHYLQVMVYKPPCQCEMCDNWRDAQKGGKARLLADRFYYVLYFYGKEVLYKPMNCNGQNMIGIRQVQPVCVQACHIALDYM